jgi:hypothetical protein
MDSRSARMLVGRIRAGVRIGTTIELLADGGPGSDLKAGDIGVIDGLSAEGNLLVSWNQGFRRELDPGATPFRALAA